MKLKITKSKARERAGLPEFGSIQFSQKEIPMINSKLGLSAVSTEDILPGRVSRGEGHITHDRITGTDDLPVRIYKHKGDRWYYPSREEEKNDENRIPYTTTYHGDHYTNCNDYAVVEIGDKKYPIDYLVAPFVKFLYDKGIKTMGSDQGGQMVIQTRPKDYKFSGAVTWKLNPNKPEEPAFISFYYECLDELKTLLDFYGLVLED